MRKKKRNQSIKWKSQPMRSTASKAVRIDPETNQVIGPVTEKPPSLKKRKLITALSYSAKMMTAGDERFAMSLIRQFKDKGYLSQKQWDHVSRMAREARKQRKDIKRPHSVYAISDGEMVKVGFSNNPIERLRSMQTGSARELMIAWAKRYPTRNAARDAEQQIHYCLKDRRIRGEWFDLSIIDDLKSGTVFYVGGDDDLPAEAQQHMNTITARN